MANLKDLSGERFGRLVVLERASDRVFSSGRKAVQWKCVCDCGNEKIVASTHLTSGDVTSCGCYYRESRQNCGRDEIHGLAGSRIYHLYENMKYRCNNPKAAGWESYGGRGIQVCDDWNRPDGFESFYKWALENGYSDDLSIDRIDVNGDYAPENCRWADKETQRNNQRNSVLITYQGKTQSAGQWSKETGLDRHLLVRRAKKGLPPEMIFAPPDPKKVRHGKRKAGLAL